MLFFAQQNDVGWDSTFFSPPLFLEQEEIGNDLETGIISDTSHPLVSGMTNTDFLDWSYNEPGQEEIKHKIDWDVIKKTSNGWNSIISAPAADSLEKNALGNWITAEKYWITAEIIHGSGKIFVCQASYYQG